MKKFKFLVSVGSGKQVNVWVEAIDWVEATDLMAAICPHMLWSLAK